MRPLGGWETWWRDRRRLSTFQIVKWHQSKSNSRCNPSNMWQVPTLLNVDRHAASLCRRQNVYRYADSPSPACTTRMLQNAGTETNKTTLSKWWWCFWFCSQHWSDSRICSISLNERFWRLWENQKSWRFWDALWLCWHPSVRENR